MIKCTVIDDDSYGIDILTEHISKVPELVLVSTFQDPITAFNNLNENSPDILFLDIDMPYFSGLDFVEALNVKTLNKKPLVIFTTGHDEYALKGFEHGVIDYLLKPITFKRFKLAIDRIIGNAEASSSKGTMGRFFFVDSEGKKIKINFSEVVFIEAAGNYVTISTITKRHTIYGTMNALQAQLPENDFCRIHKSFIISIAHIQAISGNELILGGSDRATHIPIGPTYKEVFLKKLKIQ